LQTYVGIFLEAAIPQKLVFLAFAAALIASVAIVAMRLRGSPARTSTLLADLRLACPAIGLLGAALNGLHMMQTTLALPIAPTAKMLAPGLMEMAALVAAGALAGMVAVVLNWVLEARLSPPAPTP
jgi:hypothetical protein